MKETRPYLDCFSGIVIGIGATILAYESTKISPNTSYVVLGFLVMVAGASYFVARLEEDWKRAQDRKHGTTTPKEH